MRLGGPRPCSQMGVAQADAGPAPAARRAWPGWSWPRPCRPEQRSCRRRSWRSASMAAPLIARAGGPLCRGECARAALRRSPGAEIPAAGPAVAAGTRASCTPEAVRGLCPSWVASGACRAQALQGFRLLLGPLPVGPSSPASLRAARPHPYRPFQPQLRVGCLGHPLRGLALNSDL